MQLSARNILKGKISNVTKGAVAAEVQVDIGGGNTITSTIKDVSVIIKASEVILGVE